MNSKYLLVIAAFVSWGSSCADVEADAREYVALFQLISNPEILDGRKVSVSGFNVGGSPARLFLTEAHAEIRDHSTYVYVEPIASMPARCDQTFVRIEGRFKVVRGRELWIVDLERISTIDDASKLIITCWQAD